MTGNTPNGSMALSDPFPRRSPESHSRGVPEMLAPLIVDLLITCTLFMLAGWAYDATVRWSAAGRPSPRGRRGQPEGDYRFHIANSRYRKQPI
jgi:hypothetical protein